MTQTILSFEDFKSEILTRAKSKGACEDGYNLALESKNFQDLLSAIKKYAYWCYTEGVTDLEIMKQCPNDELVKANIYVCKEDIIQKEGHSLYYSSTSKHYDSSTSEHYGSSTSKHYDSSTSEHYGSSTSKHYGSSTSKHYDSSTSEHYGSSTSEHYGSSTSKHYGSSTSKHYDNSTSKHYDNSTSEHYDSSTSEHYGSSTSEHYGSSTSKHYDNSTYGNVYILHRKDIIFEKAIVRERSTNKLYFKKNSLEIIEL